MVCVCVAVAGLKMTRHHQVRVNGRVVFETPHEQRCPREHAVERFVHFAQAGLMERGDLVELFMESKWEALAWVRVRYTYLDFRGVRSEWIGWER